MVSSVRRASERELVSPEYSGTFAALYTPFDAHGDVDVVALRGLCERLVAEGVHLVPCGTTGETPTLTDDEFRLVVRTAVDVADGRVKIVAGTGSNATAGTIQRTKLARELGADAALVVAPYYNKPSQDGLAAHFEAVADEGGLPVVLYNVPGRTASNLQAHTTLGLAGHENIVAIKEASGDLDQIQLILAGAPADFAVLSGDDAWTLPMVLLGGHGVVSVAANVLPAAMARLVARGMAGDLAEARALQRLMLPAFEGLFATTNPVPLKHVAHALGHARAGVRLPLVTTSLDEMTAQRLVHDVKTVREHVSGGSADGPHAS